MRYGYGPSINKAIPLSPKGKIFKDENPSLYMEIITYLSKQPNTKLLDYLNNPRLLKLSKDTVEIRDFLEEFLPAFIKVRNNWSDAELWKKLDDYLNNPPLVPKSSRARICKKCKTDLTGLYTISLDADVILRNIEIPITCPKCGTLNHFNHEL